MKTALSLMLFIVAFALGGCGPQWVVVKQAAPNPMTGTSGFKVEKGVFDPSFHVGDKTEAEWMSTKKPETKDSWDGDKAAMADMFAEGFLNEKEKVVIAGAPGAGVFTVRAKYVQYEPGFYAVVSSAPTVLEADVEFLDGAGNVVDMIHMEVRYSGMSAGEGARQCARQIGARAAKYLKQRVGLKS